MSKQPNDTAAWRKELDEIVEKEVNRRLEAATRGGFEQGETWACMCPSPKLSPWIKCSDRLPEINEDVLFFSSRPINSLSIHLGCMGRHGTWYEPGENRDAYSPDWVTHWMPLPEPPEEE